MGSNPVTRRVGESGRLNSPDELKQENAALRERISSLNAAILRISASLDLDTVLNEGDDSAALVIEQLIGLAADENKPSIVMGLSGPASDTLHALDALTRVPEGHFVDSLDEARHLAAQLLQS